MVSSAHTIIEPLAVVIKPVDANIAHITVSASGQCNHFASGTDFSDIEFVKQIH